MADTIQVLSTDSVEHLRHFLPNNPSALVDYDESIKHDQELRFVPSEYKVVNKNLVLEHPDGKDQESLKDTENCKRIIKALPNLTPADATDERLWVTLSVFHLRDYALARWPTADKSRSDLTKHIHNHWFANGVRPRMRDNAISRLWWMGHIASRIPGRDTDEVFDVLFLNSDYRSSLLERNSSANSVNVTAAILEITKRAYDADVIFNREAFRGFMKEVDLLGGRLHLAVLEVDDLIELLTPIYNCAYSIE